MFGRKPETSFTNQSKAWDLTKLVRIALSKPVLASLFILILMATSLVRGNGYYNLLMFWKGLPPYTWVGKGSDALWSNPDNWSTLVVPGPSDTAIFDNNCASNCSPTITADPNVGGINMRSNYGANTINRSAGVNITVGAAGWTVSAGTIASNDANITINGPLIVSGGTFNSSTGTTTVTGTAFISSGAITSSSGTFNLNSSLTMNGGTITGGSANVTIGTTYSQATAGTFNASTGTTTFTGAATLAAGTFTKTTGTMNFNSTLTVSGATVNAGSTTLGITGNYTQSSGTFNAQTGTVNFGGNISLTGGTLNGNSSTFNVTGTTSQTTGGTFNASTGTTTFTGNYSSSTSIVFASTTGTLNFLGNMSVGGGTITLGSSIVNITGNYALSAGAFTSTSGTLAVAGSFTASGAPTFTHNSGTILFNGSTQAITPLTLTYNKAIFKFENAGVDTAGTKTITGTMTLANNLTLAAYAGCGTSCAINTGTVATQGTILIANDGAPGGNGAVSMTGNTNVVQPIIASGQIPSGTVVINKGAANSVTLSGNFNATAAAQSFTITQGILDLAGNNLNITNVLTVSLNGTLLCNGGIYSAASTVVIGTIDCSAYPINWTGNAGDGNWNTAGNWSGLSVPLSTDVVIFKDTYCGANCNATINIPVTVGGLRTLSPYTGTITQASGQTFTIGTSQFRMAAGTFTGGNSNIVIGSIFTMTGGTFTSTTANLDLNLGTTISGSPVFNHNSGTVRFTATSTINLGSFTFNNLTWAGTNSTFTVSGACTVNGILTMGDLSASLGTITGGTINAKSDVVFNNYGYRGTGTVIINGNVPQNVTSISQAYIPTFTVNTSSTVTYSGTLKFNNNYTWTAGTLIATGTTVQFVGPSSSLTPGSSNSYDVVSFSSAGTTFTLSGILNVNGALTADSTSSFGTLNGGTIMAYGDVSFTNFGYKGTTNLTIAGATQTVTGVSTAFFPPFTVLSSGTVTYSGNLKMSAGYTYGSGIVDASAATLTFAQAASSATITPGATVTYSNVTFATTNGTLAVSGTMYVSGALIAGDTAAGVLNTGVVQASGSTITMNSNGYTGTATLRLAGSSNQTLSGVSTANIPNFEIASTGGTVTYSGTLKFTRNYTWISGITDASTSTLQFVASTAVTVAPSNATTFNVVTFNTTGAAVTLGGTMNVASTLTMGDGSTGSMNTGQINASGPVTFNNNGYTGSATVRIAGGSSQAVSGVGTANIPKFDISSTGGTVSLNGTLKFANDYTYNMGTVDATTGTSTALFVNTSTITPGSAHLYNATFAGTSATFTMAGTLAIDGTLTAGDMATGTITTGALAPYGNVVFNNNGYGGNAGLRFRGSTNTTITVGGSASMLTGPINVNKTGGTYVSLGSNVSFNAAGQTVNVAAGEIHLGTYNLVINTSLTLAGGTAVSLGTGTLTVGGAGVGVGPYSGGTIY